MRRSMFAFALALLTAAPCAATTIVTESFPLSFTASQGLFGGPPGAGFFLESRTSGSVGAYYEIAGNTGTINASQQGSMGATHPDEVWEGDPVPIALNFSGDPFGGFVESLFGAEIEAGVFLDIRGCIGIGSYDRCLGVRYKIDDDFPVIDEGFFLNPQTTHTPTLDVGHSASDLDALYDLSIGVPIGIGNLGATMSLELSQEIGFTPTGIQGSMLFHNLDDGQMFARSFFFPTQTPLSFLFFLDPGLWEVSLSDISLLNVFRNEMDMGLRPSLDYVIGSWSPGTLNLLGIDDSFPLKFNRIRDAGSFQVLVRPVPEPATIVPLILGLLALAVGRRLRSRSIRARRLTRH